MAGEEKDDAEHRRVRAHIEHAFGRMKNYKIIRGCRQRGGGLHSMLQGVIVVNVPATSMMVSA